MLFQHVAIEAVAVEMAPHRITSAWLEAQIAPTMQRLGVPPGRLQALSGIAERRFWDTGTLPSAGATAAARKVLAGAGVKVARFLTGSYVTSLEMAGCSITVSAADSATLALWDAPVHTAALRWGV